MTRNEALEILDHNWTRLVNTDYTDEELGKAQNMAIESLEERKHGEWVDKWHKLFKEELPMCSVCNNFSIFKSDFCPNCGAEMRGEE